MSRARITMLLGLCFACLYAAEAHALEFRGREYLLYQPPGITGPRPAVFVLHGGGGDGKGIRRFTGFDSWAERFGAVAVYPDGQFHGWNDGRKSDDNLKRAQAGIDDTPFLIGLADELARQGIIDPKRVYYAGISNGGFMVQRLACDRPEKVAGIAVIASNFQQDYECPHPDAAVPAVFFHGTNDSYVRNEGGKVATLGVKDRGRALSVADSMKFWAQKNGCGDAAPAKRSDRAAEDDTILITTDYTGCRAPLRHYLIQGGGHTWPGSARRLDMLLGTTSEEINASEAMLHFWLGQPSNKNQE